MNKKKEEKIIRVAYNDASLLEKLRVAFLIRSDKEAAKLFESYKKTYESVRKLKRNDLPLNVEIKLQNLITERETPKRRVVKTRGFALALSILLIAVITFAFLKKNSNYYGNYNEQTVKKARIETLASMKLVAQIFSNTKKLVIDNVLINTVSRPVNDGLTEVKKIIK